MARGSDVAAGLAAASLLAVERADDGLPGVPATRRTRLQDRGAGGRNMSVLVVGLNHKGAPLATLEQVALAGDALDKLLHDVSRADDVAGALVLSTCNRVEIYAEVGKFHGAVAAICELLSRHSHVPAGRADAVPVRALRGPGSCSICWPWPAVSTRWWSARARFSASCGRPCASPGSRARSAGRCRLSASLALRAGKRAQSETSVGQAGANLVSVGLERGSTCAAGTCARLNIADPARPRVPTELTVPAVQPMPATGARRARCAGHRRRRDERPGRRQRRQGRRGQHRGGEPDPPASRAARCVRGRPGSRHVRPD